MYKPFIERIHTTWIILSKKKKGHKATRSLIPFIFLVQKEAKLSLL